MKRYLAIQTLEMADNDNIFQITFDEEPLLEINSGIAGIEDYENNGLYTNKENAIDDSDVLVSGWGKFSGRRIWQLPTRIKRQLKKYMVKKEIKL